MDNNNKYIVLLNSSLKQHILTLSEKGKKRLRDKFEFLGNGLWDGGVRVKKLKGLSNNVIFEARLDRGDRILFTVGEHDKKTAIYVWGITKHDDINKNANRIIPSNAPFLNFEPEITEDYSDIIIDDLSPEYFTQENVEEKYNYECGPQKWLLFREEEWIRILQHNGKSDFEIYLLLTADQANILQEEPPLLISGTAGSGKTIISIYYLLKNNFFNKKRVYLTYNEHLKRFSQGLYKGLITKTGIEDHDNQPEFYTFRELLFEICNRYNIVYDSQKEVSLIEFERIFKNHHLYSKYDSELVWEEIRSIIKGAKPPISLGEYKRLMTRYSNSKLSQTDINRLRDYIINLQRFEFCDKIERIIKGKTDYNSLDSFTISLMDRAILYSVPVRLVLSEIQRIINKKANSFASPLLTFNEYISLGKKRAPNFIYDRGDIYTIAKYYQDKLCDEGLWDEIDLCKDVIGLIDRYPNSFNYDLVVCDEAQDFTDIQTFLIFRLAKDCNNIVFAGDPKQIINPSGFRWEEVKSRFYERGVHAPDVVNLRLNFRSVGNIIRLSNSLLDLKQRLIGISSNELKEDWKFNGIPPLLIYNINENEIIAKIKITIAGMIILVRDEMEQNRLKEIIGTELIFTINEAKGLEFDSVFIWKFISDKKSLDIWRKIKNEHLVDNIHYPHIRHEINMFYVAITRARNNLIFYDGEHPSDIWDMEDLKDHVYFTSDKDILEGLWQKISTPEEWDEQGDYFFDRKYYPAAMECYRNSGNTSKAEVAEAYNWQQNNQLEKAAVLFERNGLIKRAAENYENIQDYKRALDLWERLNDRKRAEVCVIRLFEANGEFDMAAEGWKKLKNYPLAISNWEKANNYRAIAGYYHSIKNYNDASRYYELDRDYVESAECFKKLKKYGKAAEQYFKGEKYNDALTLFKKLKNKDGMIQCYLKLEDYYNIALIYEKNQDYDNAIGAFEKFIKLSTDNIELIKAEAQLHETGRSIIKSAIRYSALKDYKKSAQIFYEKEGYIKALEQFEIIDNKEMIAECYFKINDYYNYATIIEDTEIKNRFTLSEKGFYDYIYEDNNYNRKKADILFKEARLFQRKGFYKKALSRYKAINYPEMIYESYLNIDEDDDAIKYFFEENQLEYLEKFIKGKEKLRISGELLKYIYKKMKTHRRWYHDIEKQRIDLSAQIFLKALEQENDEEATSIAYKYIDKYYDASSMPIEEMPSSMINLVIELKHYNMVFAFARDVAYYKTGISNDIPKDMEAMLNLIKHRGEEGDDYLLACYYYVYDKDKFDELIVGFDINQYNSDLFSFSGHYQRAVDYFIGLGEINKALKICKSNRQYQQMAAIYENTGDLLQAGKCYFDANNFNAAIRCYMDSGAYDKAARVCEKIMDYQKAMEFWDRCNRPKEIDRIKKMLHRNGLNETANEDLKAQLELF
ncbi:MAG: 3'-5' exonuclease [Spirochaetota bacterium]|nr:3'-5' exonuclease [Spirochaetota bacterium]